MLKEKKGRLLISEPSLNNSIFFKSVILLTHHNEDESAGLILNNPTKINLNQLIKDLPLIDFPVYLGGPVERKSLNFIHTLGTLIPNSVKISTNTFFGGDFKKVLQLIKNKQITKDKIRFFVGYTGWGSNQLNEEIMEKSWLVDDANSDICMIYSNKKLWNNIIRKQNSKYVYWANMPNDPSLN